MTKSYNQGVKLFYLLIVLCFNSKFGLNQVNLVPNSSFEIYDYCPDSWLGGGEICRATPWFQPYFPNQDWCGGSSDYYHICASTIPNNFGGYQFPKSGNGLAAISTFRYISNTGDLAREYLSIEFLNSLILNKKYCIKWYSSLAEEISKFGCNRIGAYFSFDTLFQTGSQYNYIPVIPHIENLEIVIDTANWVLFKQVYIAQGFEKFMTVGNFRPGSMTDTSDVINPNGWAVYYYFDDFGVYELPEITAGDDYEICEYGGSVQLQASCEGCWDGLQYRWWPSVGLSDTSILNPIATPVQTTTYYFGLIDTTETVPCIVDLADSVTVTVCDGIEPPAFNFTIQPNPGKDKVELVFTHVPEDTELLLYDLRGRLILQITIPKETTSYQLDISHLANAQYMLKLQNSSGAIRKKLMKM
jgi:hypothetical protein